MNDFLKTLTVVALVGALLITAISIIGFNSYSQQTRALQAYDRCLTNQLEMAKLRDRSAFSAPSNYCRA